ncbi:MAG TPA: carbohydrate-binding family 9-like protein [Bryobacteraceae bacterium]|nr:carbohydrate-binding family 9-like protein [Bryobacteraceae bacterium]
MNVLKRICLWGTLASAASFGSDGTMISVHATSDVALDTKPDSAFWQGAGVVKADKNNFGKPAGFAMEVRSRWTAENLYLLYTCPYQELYLKPNPVTATETNELWNWDVAEIFIGADFKNIKKYREFEVSPQSEWVDLDIDRDSKHPEDGWTWNSGFKVATRIDKANKIWYAALRIPWKSIDSKPPQNGAEFRMNLYLSEGPKSNHTSITWQPTMNNSYHVPERFGLLRLESK